MTAEEFRVAFAKEIDAVTASLSRRYSVTDDEMASALFASVRKYLPDAVSAGDHANAAGAVAEFMASLNLDDLCLAVACAKGDDAAWEDFFRDYRGYLTGISRAHTSDGGKAEQLADSTFAELYGLREAEGERVSKFSFYSGRGSLKGWLRAVVFQLSADMHRQSNRYVQTEEDEDLDRLAKPVEANGRHSTEITFVRDRYRAAVADALRRGFTQLEPKERLLLAYYYCDEMTLREIGRLFNVHEASISRWIAKTNKHVRKLVEKNLANEHRFKRREISEAIELAGRELDITAKEYLFEALPADRKAGKAAEGA